MKKLTNISEIYYQLKEAKQTYTVFPFTTNNVNFDIFLDIDKVPFRLGFLVSKSNYQLWLEVKNGFLIDTNLPKEKYYELIKLLNLKTDKDNPFSTVAFFEQFNNQIPKTLIKYDKDYIRNIILAVSPNIEEKDKIYYLGIKDWDKINNGNHRSPKNLEKTRLLYPELYLSIKDKDVSVKYTSNKNEENQIPNNICD
jgi:hypothetical protein